LFSAPIFAQRSEILSFFVLWKDVVTGICLVHVQAVRIMLLHVDIDVGTTAARALRACGSSHHFALSFPAFWLTTLRPFLRNRVFCAALLAAIAHVFTPFIAFVHACSVPFARFLPTYEGVAGNVQEEGRGKQADMEDSRTRCVSHAGFLHAGETG
jgi:hypothetical protein